jgi:chemotaxis protein methyltransferase CheR
VVDASLRELVRFELRNLAHDDAELWQPGSLDVVFCRNVIMYFAPDQARALLARIARALKPGGYLFLGEAETLRGLSEECELRHTEGAFYYRLGVAPASPQAVELPQPTKLIRRARPPIAAPVQAEFEACAPTSGSALQPVEAARELYREERFVDALAALRGSGGSMAPPAGAQGALLEAMLLVHGGELAAAEDACRRQLGAAGGDANARYVLALCREGLGDHAGAIAQSRSAARLDPAFAMPRLHLGMAARRVGDWTAARDQLLQALTLLAHEDDERLLLFGGGFTRAALLAFCGATLRDCGGRP